MKHFIRILSALVLILSIGLAMVSHAAGEAAVSSEDRDTLLLQSNTFQPFLGEESKPEATPGLSESQEPVEDVYQTINQWATALLEEDADSVWDESATNSGSFLGSVLETEVLAMIDAQANDAFQANNVQIQAKQSEFLSWEEGNIFFSSNQSTVINSRREPLTPTAIGRVEKANQRESHHNRLQAAASSLAWKKGLAAPWMSHKAKQQTEDASGAFLRYNGDVRWGYFGGPPLLPKGGTAVEEKLAQESPAYSVMGNQK